MSSPRSPTPGNLRFRGWVVHLRAPDVLALTAAKAPHPHRLSALAHALPAARLSVPARSFPLLTALVEECAELRHIGRRRLLANVNLNPLLHLSPLAVGCRSPPPSTASRLQPR